jgi:hypothetical protein
MLPMLNAVAPLAKILFSTIEKSVPDKDLHTNRSRRVCRGQKC